MLNYCKWWQQTVVPFGNSPCLEVCLPEPKLLLTEQIKPKQHPGRNLCPARQHSQYLFRQGMLVATQSWLKSAPHCMRLHDRIGRENFRYRPTEGGGGYLQPPK